MSSNNQSIPLSASQLSTIQAYGDAKNYPAMYRYIADQIKSGGIPVLGGVTSDQYYWFDQAARINQGDTSSAASVFIRSATKNGLALDNKPTSDAYVQGISDTIGKKVLQDLKKNQALPPFSKQLDADISSSLSEGGMTIGGWGGSFYFWDEVYTTPAGLQTTVGGAILASPVERAKFIEVNKLAIADTVERFGTDLLKDPGFSKAMLGSLRSFGPGASLSSNLVGLELASAASKEIGQRLGQQAVRNFEEAIIRELGLRPYFSQSDAPNHGVPDVAAGLFAETLYGGGVDDESQALVTDVKNELQTLLAGKNTANTEVYQLPGAQDAQGERGAAGVIILLGNGESITIDANGRFAYNLKDNNSTTPAWVTQDLLGNKTRQVDNLNGTQTLVTHDANGAFLSRTDRQTFDDGSSLNITTTPNGTETTSEYDSQGILSGRSKTLSNADGVPTSDSLANMLQNLRDATGDLDDLVLDAAELRAMSGSQAQGEAWGGARLLTLGDGALGDYYRHHQDIQTGTDIPLLLDDPHTQGLGLLDGFELGNGAGDAISPVVRHQFDSNLRTHHKNHRPFSCIKSSGRSANDVNWRVTA